MLNCMHASTFMNVVHCIQAFRLSTMSRLQCIFKALSQYAVLASTNSDLCGVAAVIWVTSTRIAVESRGHLNCCFACCDLSCQLQHPGPHNWYKLKWSCAEIRAIHEHIERETSWERQAFLWEQHSFHTRCHSGELEILWMRVQCMAARMCTGRCSPPQRSKGRGTQLWYVLLYMTDHLTI